MKSTKQGNTSLGASKVSCKAPKGPISSKTSLLSPNSRIIGVDSSNKFGSLKSSSNFDQDLFSTPEEQLEEISKLLKAPLVKGEKWNLVASDWFEGWKRFTGYQDENKIVKEMSFLKEDIKHTHLGLIDNSKLLDENGELREKLEELIDYELVPLEAWVKLVDWFGVEDEIHVIEREVILIIGENELKVEIYEMSLNMFLRYKRDDVRKVSISRSKKISNLKDKVKIVFDIPDHLDIRIYIKKDIYQAISDFKFQLSDLTDEQIMVESQTENKQWPTTLTQTNTASSV